MMMSQPEKLSGLAISKMLEADAEDEEMIVQVFQINTTKNGRIICSISDGEFFTKAYLNDDKIIKPGRDQFAIINIKSHGVLKNNIGITNLKFVTKYPQKLGSPLDWASSKENAHEVKSSKEFKLQKLQKIQKTETKKVQMPSAAKTASGKESQYDSIDDLHIGLKRWTILCRITRKQFKSSAKKGTKILQIQLVDKSKKRIIGTFFHDAAVDFNDYLRQGAVYQISKGNITQGDYNNSKNQKLSPYRLIFDAKSQFNEISDVSIIAKSQDSAITLGNLYERKTLNSQFDVVAYVVEVKQQTTFQKDGKDISMKQVIVADPQAKITMKLGLWRWKQDFSKDMVGKVLIFSRFILKQYKGNLSLYSGVRSSIIANHGHSMKKYQNRMMDVGSFTATSTQVTYQKTDQDTTQFCFNTKQLRDKVDMMGTDDQIKSILYVWVIRFAVNRKWSYQGCPKCKKAAEKYSKCANCGQAIEQTDLHFSMGVQMSDAFGSIWITAYDELAKKIFHDMGKTAAKQLQQFQKAQLDDLLQNYMYQPFKLKIITKKDVEGRIRHNAGKLLQLSDDRSARQNLRKIQIIMRK